jgi:hypothetical protein
VPASLTATTVEFRHFSKKYQKYYKKWAVCEQNKNDFRFKVSHFATIFDQF